MNLLLLLTTLFVGAYTAPYDTSIMTEWNEYKSEHGKHYTPEEDERRLQVYLATKKYVQEHNLEYEQGRTSFTMAINQFADWYPDELTKLNGAYRSDRPKGKRIRLEPGQKLPDSINWVTKGAVTSVKDQLQCHSDYAFSAVGAIEGLMFRMNKTVEDLSAQEILDCSRGNGNVGCKDGFVDFAFLYVLERGGLDSEKSYPYTGQARQCRADKGVTVANITDFNSISCEKDLKVVVATVGPVSILFAAGKDFLNYRGGVFDKECGSLLNQAMLVVGYGKDERTGKDYWLIKNSWGKKWGEKGYARVVMGKNKCGLARLASYPV